MRLRADLTEGIAVDTVRKIVIFLSRMNKRRCVIRATPTDFIVLNDSSTSRNYWIEVKIKQEEMFGEYDVGGLTPDEDEIYMDLSASDLSQALSGVDSMIKLRLTREGTVPHLSVKTETVNNSIPVTLLMMRQWAEYQRTIPTDAVLIGIYLPAIKTVQKIMNSIKNSGAIHVALIANFRGEFEISSRTDTTRVSVCITDLQSERYPLSMNLGEEYHVRTVLDCKHFHNFISNIPNFYTYLFMQIDQIGNAYFSTSQADSSLSAALPGHNRV